jgi:hypothetical protein
MLAEPLPAQQARWLARSEASPSLSWQEATEMLDRPEFGPVANGLANCGAAFEVGLADFTKDSRLITQVRLLHHSPAGLRQQAAGPIFQEVQVLVSSGPERLTSSQRFGAGTFRPCCLLTAVPFPYPFG